MNNNFTHKGKRIVFNLRLTTSKVVVTALAIFFSSVSTVSAKSIDLPNSACLKTASGAITSDADGVKLNAASLDIYLNPAHSEATVNLNNLSLYNNAVSVSDMTGARVMSMTIFNGSSVKLNINSLKAGIYIVKVVSADGTVAQHKMIVSNR